MNAIQFIKEHGVDKAREVVEGAPEGSTHFVGSTYLKLIGAVWWNAWLPEWSHKDNCMVKKWKCESIELMKTWGEVYKLEDLKRLVESVDLINSVGGLTIANKITFQKRLRNEKATHFIQHPENQKLIQLFGRNQRKPEAAIKFDLFEQAIADYKSIYGGEHV